MTDFYDINTKNRARFGNPNPDTIPNMDTRCLNCGSCFGDHYGDYGEIFCPTSIPASLGTARFWECYVEGTSGGRHYKHWTLESAQTEAERLARLPDVQGKTVFLFECIGKCKAEQTPIKWEVPRC